MSDKVSIVIPVKDRPNELVRTLNSVLEQTHLNFEVIIIENNSVNPHEIARVVNLFNCRKFNLFNLQECSNANVARNYGAFKSTGDYIAFLDSDDEWEPNHLESSISTLKRNKADFVYGGAVVFDGVSESFKEARDLLLDESPVDYLVGFNRGYAQTSSYLMKKTVLKKVIWDESLKRAQDLDFFIRVYKNFRCVCTNIYSSRINWLKGEKRNTDIQAMLKFFKRYYKDMLPSSRVRYFMIILLNVKSISDIKSIFLAKE
ncbi:TPA: glycosyltransferase family 2 protein, partial [Vibrio alginolyticus]|nr:glycosyltransferase family 2 protein [Vibrio parahaemolyticus]HCZ9258678.1 glycosyltransferase family 2 protein [Vibrio alginolyticus]HCZ9295709.1 glycosyltransferase family 2 protein [Vibrio alginolyticus]